MNLAWVLIKWPALECCEEMEGMEVRIIHTFCDGLRFQVLFDAGGVSQVLLFRGSNPWPLPVCICLVHHEVV